jgi:hypothetical protein
MKKIIIRNKQEIKKLNLDKVRKLDQSGSDFERESYHVTENETKNETLNTQSKKLRINFTASPFRPERSLLDKKLIDADNIKA